MRHVRRPSLESALLAAGAEYDLVHMLLLVFGRCAFGCAVAYVIALSLQAGRGGCVTAVLRCRLWAPLATLSYSAYLLQYIPMLLIVKMVPPPSAASTSSTTSVVYVTFATFLGALLCVYAGVFALALLLFVVVEKPVMNLR